jgi:AcrR family transcriptional regulator
MNHVMSTAPPDLRTAQLADTRHRIAQAAAEVMLREGPAALTFPAVAEAAGVSLRTVYRHFANKDDLVAGAVQVGGERTHASFPPGTVRLSHMREFLPALWKELDAQRDYIALQHAAPSGKEVRRERLQLRRRDVVRALEEDFGDIPAADRDRLADLVTVLIGSSLLFDLVDHLGLAVEDAAAVAAYAIEAVAERARREGGIR